MSNNDTPNQGNNKRHPHDWIFFCDICGDITWASKGTLLGIYTGHGNQMACPNCVLAIDYSLVPYKAPPEKSIPWARTNTLYDTPAAQIPNDFPPFNFNIVPGSGSPGFMAEASGSLTIDQELYIPIEQLMYITIDKIGKKV